jgi:EAL domain-containing protein (putative c-di-GMP-specific phosphodiesterase class I)
VVEQIDHIIKESGIQPSTLSLEITESWLMDSVKPFHNVLQKIRNLGVNLEVDDFGRGYSSFRYLQSLPVSILKIDSLFIRRLGVNGDNSEIVRSIVGLARSLGMSVIAEGVETEAQMARLKELDCPFVQGYYISEPLSSRDADELLHQKRMEPGD